MKFKIRRTRYRAEVQEGSGEGWKVTSLQGNTTQPYAILEVDTLEALVAYANHVDNALILTPSGSPDREHSVEIYDDYIE